MTINAINAKATSALSAVDGRTLSTLNAINGQTIAGGSPPAPPVTTNLEMDWNPFDYLTSDPSITTGSPMNFNGWGPGSGIFTFQPQVTNGSAWQAAGSTHSCNNLPTGYFDTVTRAFKTVEAASTYTSITVFAVLKILSDPGNPHSIIGGNTGALQLRVYADKQNVNKAFTTDLGSSTTALSASVFQQITMTFSGTALNYWLGSSTDGSISVSSTITAATNLIGASQGGEYGYCYLARLLVYTGVMSGGNITTMQSYLTTYYGV